MRLGSLILLLSLVGLVQISCKEQSKTGLKKGHDKIDGAKIFRNSCTICHGADGGLGLNGSKDIKLSQLNKAERIILITKGRGQMTGFESLLSSEEIEAVATYSFTLGKE